MISSVQITFILFIQGAHAWMALNGPHSVSPGGSALRLSTAMKSMEDESENDFYISNQADYFAVKFSNDMNSLREWNELYEEPCGEECEVSRHGCVFT